MEIKQIAELLNSVLKETMGLENPAQEDLSNVVDLGVSFMNANFVDNNLRVLIDHVGTMIFNDRTYKGKFKNVLRIGTEYASIIEKVSADLPDVVENESAELVDGTSYDTNIYYAPKGVEMKLFDKKTTFEVPISITDIYLRSAFDSPAQLSRFISMIENKVLNRLELSYEQLIDRCINNIIAETVYAEYGASALSSKSGVKAVNLLYLYNNTFNPATPLTVATCLYNADFLRFAYDRIYITMGLMEKYSRLFNVNGKERFTTKDLQHVVLHNELTTKLKTVLKSNTFHDDFIALPNYEEVPYWQGTGNDLAFGKKTEINVKTSSGHDVDATGVLGVIFDHDAVAVNDSYRRTTTDINGKAEFRTFYHKSDARYLNDLNENCVVFLIA